MKAKARIINELQWIDWAKMGRKKEIADYKQKIKIYMDEPEENKFLHSVDKGFIEDNVKKLMETVKELKRLLKEEEMLNNILHDIRGEESGSASDI